MQNLPEPVPLQPADLDRAAHVLTRAFHDDPGVVWLLPNEGQRRRLLYWNHKKFLQYGLQAGRVFTTPGAVEGIATWLPPERPMMSFMDALRLGLLALPFKATPLQFVRFVAMMNLFEKMHKQDAPKRHWYLNVLGVDPERQGQGVGGRLIAPILEQADKDRLPSYVETGKEINVTFYQKHGFEVLKEGNLPLGGPRWWTMLREPIG
jgi:ribosomal protein S18 acetylase RimI-like enzyme